MMTIKRLQDLMDENNEARTLTFAGTCHDCKAKTEVSASFTATNIEITGGAVYETEREKFFVKCDACFQKDPELRNYQDCEVYSRVVGYLRPVGNWNPGKQAEFKDRAVFKPDSPENRGPESPQESITHPEAC